MSSEKSSSDEDQARMPTLFASVAEARSRSRSVHFDINSGNTTYDRRGSSGLQDALTWGTKRKSEVGVVLDGKNDFVRTYSTFDQITGHVSVQYEKDTLIGDMNIAFEGQSRTFIEKIASASPTVGRTTGKHVFLRVQQPIDRTALPEDNLAKAGVKYQIPFTFIVPDRLLPHICTHKVCHEGVRQAHLKLPPSLGEPMLAGEGNTLMDDLTPEMAQISYMVKVRIGKLASTGTKFSSIEEAIKRIRIVPAREEEPPISVDDNSKAYILRKEKNVRKGVFKIGKKLGRLTAEVAQPKSLRLPAIKETSSAPVTTMASVTLRFDPVSECEQPPQLQNMAARLKVWTFFGAAAYTVIPAISRPEYFSSMHGVYPENVNLSCRNVGSVIWTKHSPEERSRSCSTGTADLSRRDSNVSDLSGGSASSGDLPAASKTYDGSLPFYTAKVLVPVSLPHHSSSNEETAGKSPLSRSNKKQIFPPSFHTCIISRVYALELGLSFNPVSSSGNTNALSSSSVTLRTPIQISQEASSAPPVGFDTSALDTFAPIEGTQAYDEALARHLDHQLNFSFNNPFASPDEIPEYEEVQSNNTPVRHASIAVPPSGEQREQPPEYYSPFRSSSAGLPQGGRRVSIQDNLQRRMRAIVR